MPRIARSKDRSHASAVQLPSKRAFAAPAEQVQEIGLEEGVERSDEEPLGESSKLNPKKGLVFTPPAPLPLHPYSRSHIRREKRKAQHHLAGGELHSVAAALSESLGEVGHAQERARVRSKEEKQAEKQRDKARSEGEGKIGDGKGRTLSEKARRKQIALETKRIPAIMKHPAYKQNPWATIRLHAGNSLATAKEPAAGVDASLEQRGKGMEVE